MRKVSKTIVEAFLAERPAKLGNTHTDGKVLYLHNNAIAWHGIGGGVTMTLAGWNTVTTRERLNTLCRVAGLNGGWGTRQGQALFNGQPIGDNDHITL